MGYTTENEKEYLDTIQKYLKMVQLLLGGIGAIALIVAVIGISNTMTTSVFDRINEIGVLKVLGCDPDELQLLFLTEAGIIGAAGGIMVQKMGIDTLSQGKEIFVPISNISIFADIPEQCDAPHEKIVLLIDNTIPPIEMYVNRLKELKQQGYKLAIRKLAVSDFENYREVLKLMDYVLLNNRKIAIDKAKIYFGKLFPNINLGFVNGYFTVIQKDIIHQLQDFSVIFKITDRKLTNGKFIALLFQFLQTIDIHFNRRNGIIDQKYDFFMRCIAAAPVISAKIEILVIGSKNLFSLRQCINSHFLIMMPPALQ